MSAPPPPRVPPRGRALPSISPASRICEDEAGRAGRLGRIRRPCRIVGETSRLGEDLPWNSRRLNGACTKHFTIAN